MTKTVVGIASLLSALTVLIGSHAHAQLAPLKQSIAPSAADLLASQSAAAQMAGDHEKALQLADGAIKADSKEAWGYYDRGDALASLHRLDDALTAFRQAEQRFAVADSWGKSVAIWGEANVFRQAGRCKDASPIFEQYASFVERLDTDAAALARKCGTECVPASTPH
jgi:tetratricopeptide (TPR) repeat protein